MRHTIAPNLAPRAGRALGQLIRTAYLCDYFTLPEFRRSVHQILSRGESVHALQRQICARALPAHRGRRIEELISTSGALREIGPVGFRHINFRGTYRLPVERYAERLLVTAA
jgi:hypothetical protein